MSPSPYLVSEPVLQTYFRRVATGLLRGAEDLVDAVCSPSSRDVRASMAIMDLVFCPRAFYLAHLPPLHLSGANRRSLSLRRFPSKTP